MLLFFLATEAGTAEQKRLIEKKRNILILINQYLIECGRLYIIDEYILNYIKGYFETAERLQHEAGPTISKVLIDCLHIYFYLTLMLLSLKLQITSI